MFDFFCLETDSQASQQSSRLKLLVWVYRCAPPLGQCLMLSCPGFWDLRHEPPLIYTPEFSPQSPQLMRKYPSKLANLPTSDSPNGLCPQSSMNNVHLPPILLGPHSTSLCPKVGKSSHAPYFRHLKLSLRVSHSSSKHPNSHNKKKPPSGCLLQTLQQLSECWSPQKI